MYFISRADDLPGQRRMKPIKASFFVQILICENLCPSVAIFVRCSRRDNAIQASDAIVVALTGGLGAAIIGLLDSRRGNVWSTS